MKRNRKRNGKLLEPVTVLSIILPVECSFSLFSTSSHVPFILFRQIYYKLHSIILMFLYIV